METLLPYFYASVMCFFMYLENIHQKLTALHMGYVCYVNNVASACEDFSPRNT